MSVENNMENLELTRGDLQLIRNAFAGMNQYFSINGTRIIDVHRVITMLEKKLGYVELSTFEENSK